MPHLKLFLSPPAQFLRRLAASLPFACLAFLSACDRAPTNRVVIYTSVDEPFARAVLKRFEADTGLTVEAVYDTEAGKTTSFLHRLRREAESPRADVWWSSEVFTSVELAAEGLLQPYESSEAADIPSAWKDPDHFWTGTAARARVVAYHPDRIDPAELPPTWQGYATSDWAPRVAIANPQFGTTRGHVGAMFAFWGPEAARDFLRTLKTEGATVAEGNGQTVRLVAGGQVDLGFTDTDDVWVMQERGEPIELVYPRMGPDRPAMWIPCTAALVKGAPHPDAARRLIDYLVSAAVEEQLAASDSRNVPVRPALRKQVGYDGPTPEPLPYAEIAATLETAMQATRDILLR
jgi:iron(III) transport system substrate-binding protein